LTEVENFIRGLQGEFKREERVADREEERE
jgi:hypothetical protein